MKSSWKILELVIALNMSDDFFQNFLLLILYNSVIKDDFLLFHLNTDLCLRDLFRKLFMTLLQAEFDEFENC